MRGRGLLLAADYLPQGVPVHPQVPGQRRNGGVVMGQRSGRPGHRPARQGGPQRDQRVGLGPRPRRAGRLGTAPHPLAPHHPHRQPETGASAAATCRRPWPAAITPQDGQPTGSGSVSTVISRPWSPWCTSSTSSTCRRRASHRHGRTSPRRRHTLSSSMSGSLQLISLVAIDPGRPRPSPSGYATPGPSTTLRSEESTKGCHERTCCSSPRGDRVRSPDRPRVSTFDAIVHRYYRHSIRRAPWPQHPRPAPSGPATRWSPSCLC